MSIRSCACIAVKVKYNGIFCLSQNLREQIFLVVDIVYVKITWHRLLNDLVALLSRIVMIICIIMTVVCNIFEYLGTKLQLFMKALRYVIRNDVPRCDADFLITILII